MDLEALQAEAAKLFPQAVKFAIAKPGVENPSLECLSKLCWANFESLGFRCQADCFAVVVPKITGRLSLEAWCKADLIISGWPLNITMRPFYLGAGYAHFEIRHNGPLPSVTETGYRSVFTTLATFAEFTPEKYLAAMIPSAPRAHQLSLF